MGIDRKPALKRTHPADVIPDRPASVALEPSTPSVRVEETERLTEQHNVRIRPSVKKRLNKAVDKLRYETGDRSISIASITDSAIEAYLTQHGC